MDRDAINEECSEKEKYVLRQKYLLRTMKKPIQDSGHGRNKPLQLIGIPFSDNKGPKRTIKGSFLNIRMQPNLFTSLKPGNKYALIPFEKNDSGKISLKTLKLARKISNVSKIKHGPTCSTPKGKNQTEIIETKAFPDEHDSSIPSFNSSFCQFDHIQQNHADHYNQANSSGFFSQSNSETSAITSSGTNTYENFSFQDSMMNTESVQLNVDEQMPNSDSISYTPENYFREVHNERERNRRSRMKDSYKQMSEYVPNMNESTDFATGLELTVEYLCSVKTKIGNTLDSLYLAHLKSQ